MKITPKSLMNFRAKNLRVLFLPCENSNKTFEVDFQTNENSNETFYVDFNQFKKFLRKTWFFCDFRYSRRNRSENEGVRKGPPDLRTGHIGSRLRSPSGRVKWSFGCFKFFWSRVLIEFSSVIFKHFCQMQILLCAILQRKYRRNATCFPLFSCTVAFVDPRQERTIWNDQNMFCCRQSKGIAICFNRFVSIMGSWYDASS